ncbi:MAG TPA: rod shape-determining protein MreC [Acidimicrobiales bacterium]|nr:rod shape-determining protein MreC [Acidimicrobiales bacterium]
MALRSPGRTRFTLLFLVLFSITIITLDFRSDAGVLGAVRDGAADALAPVRDAVGAVFSPVGDTVGGITGYGELEEENARLRDRIAELEGEGHRDEGAAAELGEALRLMRLDDVAGAPTVAARVVSAPISNFEQTIELDRGSKHGIAVDMPVVTGAGLVGRVVNVSGSRATVRLVTDPASAVAVRLHSGETGVAEGDGPRRPLSLGLIDIGADVSERDVVVTSGLEGSALPSYFPAGLVVGRVVSVEPAPGEQQLDIRIEPVADLANLRYVRVVQVRR